MASAQVQRKQEHLEAGKRRLEEFRKKKAAEQAKKAASASQDHAFDIRPHQKQPLATEPVQRMDLDGAGTSDEPGQAVMGPSAAVTGNDNKAIGFPFKNEQDSLYDTTVTPPFSVKYSNAHSADSAQTDADNKNFERYGASGFVRSMDVNHSLETEGLNNDVGIYTGLRGKLPYETATDHSSFYGRDGSQSTENRSSLMQSSVTNPGYSHDSTAKVSPQNSVGTLRQANPGNASMLISAHTSSSFYEDSIQPTSNARGSAHDAGQRVNGIAHINDSLVSDYEERKLSSYASSLPSVNNSAPQAFEATGFSSDVRSSPNHVPQFSA